jgi:hypothetical protein
VRQALDFQDPAVGGHADLAQGRQVLEASAHPEVIGVVDRGFGPQRPTLLVVLLEVGVLVVDVQGGHHALGNNARPASAVGGGLSLHLATEDQLHLFWTAQIDVFTDDLLEEAASVESALPDLSEGELGLEDGQVVAVTGPAILGAVGMGQAAQPLAEEGIDLGGS